MRGSPNQELLNSSRGSVPYRRNNEGIRSSRYLTNVSQSRNSMRNRDTEVDDIGSVEREFHHVRFPDDYESNINRQSSRIQNAEQFNQQVDELSNNSVKLTDLSNTSRRANHSAKLFD